MSALKPAKDLVGVFFGWLGFYGILWGDLMPNPIYINMTCSELLVGNFIFKRVVRTHLLAPS